MRKNWIIKITALAVVAVMLVGCGPRTPEAPPEITPPPVDAPTPPPANGNETGPVNGIIETEWQYDAGFTETPMDLGGRNVHIITGHGPVGSYRLFNYWDPIDLTPPETLELIGRLGEIGRDYNATFTFEESGPQAQLRVEMLLHRVAGDTPNHLINMGLTQTGKELFFQDDLYMHMEDPAIAHIIDLHNNPWPEAGKLTTMFGRQFGVHFMMANSGELLRSVMTFNVEFMDRFNLGNFYDMVWDREWNWENFRSICTRIVTGSNGQVVPITIRRESEIMPNFVAANGGYLVYNTPAGFRFVGHENDAHLEAVQFLSELNLAGYINIDVELAWHLAADGHAMFIPGQYEALRRLTRQEIQSEFSFGLLPTPMGPRMDDYVSAQFAAEMWFIANDLPEDDPVYPSAEQAAAILVAFANRLSKINIMETEVRHGVQDDESLEIVGMLLGYMAGIDGEFRNRIVLDYSRALGASRARITDAVNESFRGEATPVAAFQTQQPVIQNAFDQFQLLQR